MSRHRTAMPRTAVKTRSQSDAAVAHSHHERAPIWLSTWSVRRAAWDGLDGLCSLRIISKSASCVNLACVINTDHVGISHVTGSSYFVRALHEVLNHHGAGRASRDVRCALHLCGVRRKACVVRLGSIRSIYCAALVSSTTRAKPSAGPGGAPKSNPSQQVARPFTYKPLPWTACGDCCTMCMSEYRK